MGKAHYLDYPTHTVIRLHDGDYEVVGRDKRSEQLELFQIGGRGKKIRLTAEEIAKNARSIMKPETPAN